MSLLPLGSEIINYLTINICFVLACGLLADDLLKSTVKCNAKANMLFQPTTKFFISRKYTPVYLWSTKFS